MSVATTVSDLGVESAVTKELAACQELAFTDVSVAVASGVVTLTGDVPGPHERSTAAEAALRTDGVQAVVNALVIREEPFGESRVATEVRRAIADAFVAHARRAAAEISVAVDGSTVILGGTAETGRERDRARDAAGSIPRVPTVDCRIRVLAS